MFTILNEYFDELNKLSSDNNTAYSPISTRSALQLYKYLYNSAAFDFMLNDKDYLSFENVNNAKFVNRIWANTFFNASVPNKLQQYAHFIDMTNSQLATKTKDLFVAKETNNFIEKTGTVLSNELKYDLMNIVYFKDIWAKISGYKLNFMPMTFTNIDGSTMTVKNFVASSKDVLENDNCYLVALQYKSGNKCWLVYPKTDINRVNFNNLTCKNVVASLYIPEFEIENDYQLDKVFLPDGDIVAMDQVAKIKFDHTGTEAAAVTEIAIRGAIRNLEVPQRITLVFNKPFMYAIEDTRNNDFIFIGKITKF